MNSLDMQSLTVLSGLTPLSDSREELIRSMSLKRDRDILIDRAQREGVASFLYKNLKTSGLLESLSPSQRERLEACYFQTLRLNIRLIRDLKQILVAVNQKGIRIVLLQGIILLAQLYSDIGLRPLGDIDLWVLQEDYQVLIGVLESLGYERDPLYPNTLRRGLTVLDLHTHLMGADRIRTRALLICKDQGDIFKDTQVINLDGSEARCLNRYDQVLYLGLHALKHNLDRLLWLADIDALLADWGESDWAAGWRRAEEWGQRKALCSIVFLLARLFAYRLPIKARTFMRETRLNLFEKHLLRKRIRGNSLPQWAPLVLFSPEKGVRKRLMFTLETLFPKPDILKQVFEHSDGRTAWHLYALRILQLVRMARMCFKVTFLS
jgi:hypothetical protein